MSNAEKWWMGQVAQLPCCGCGAVGVQVHHVTGHPFRGVGKKAADVFTIPLCPECHESLHRGVKTWELRHGAQVELLAATIETVARRLMR